MAIWNETPLSDLEDEFRIDAEYYRSDYKEYARELNLIDSIPLGQVAYITDGQHGYFKLDPHSDIKQITARHISHGLVDKSTADCLSHETHNKNLRSSLIYGDVLVTSSGTIGNIGYVTEEIPPANIDQDLFRVHIRNGELNPLFLWIFLQTRFGQFQIKRFITGQVQFHLSLTKARKIRVPIRSWQDHIVEICQKYVDLRKNAKSLYSHAAQLLEQELGLDKIQFDNSFAYEARFSETKIFSRLDGEFFRPRYKQLRKQVEKYKGGFEFLKENIECLSPNISPSKFPTHPYSYIELANINPQIGIVNGSKEVLGKEAPSRAKRQVSAGDVIASAVVGSVDKAALISEYEEGFLASTGFFHFRSEKYSPEYLLILLRSSVMAEQLKQQATGGILSAVPDNNLKYIIVPTIPVSIQDEITELVRNSHRCYRESQSLLAQAKTRVEELIEKGVSKNETFRSGQKPAGGTLRSA